VSGPSPTWEAFAGEVAQAVFVPVESVRRETRLIEDLDADSLAVVELVIAMVDDYDLTVPDGIDPARWKGITAGQLFDSVVQGSLP
jgi:acyl carrier protein